MKRPLQTYLLTGCLILASAPAFAEGLNVHTASLSLNQLKGGTLQENTDRVEVILRSSYSSSTANFRPRVVELPTALDIAKVDNSYSCYMPTLVHGRLKFDSPSSFFGPGVFACLEKEGIDYTALSEQFLEWTTLTDFELPAEANMVILQPKRPLLALATYSVTAQVKKLRKVQSTSEYQPVLKEVVEQLAGEISFFTNLYKKSDSIQLTAELPTSLRPVFDFANAVVETHPDERTEILQKALAEYSETSQRRPPRALYLQLQYMMAEAGYIQQINDVSSTEDDHYQKHVPDLWKTVSSWWTIPSNTALCDELRHPSKLSFENYPSDVAEYLNLAENIYRPLRSAYTQLAVTCQ